MKKINIQHIILCLIMIAAFPAAQAQESNTMYFMKGMNQSTLMNPALHNDSSKVIIGLPVLSGMSVEANSPFAVNDFMHKGTGDLADSLVLDFERLHDKLNQVNTMVENFSMPLFFLGIRAKHSFFSLGISQKEMARTSFNKNLVTLIKDGNEPFMGKDYDLGTLGVNAMHYFEYALGYSNELMNGKLTLGIKAKMLYGKSGLQTERNAMRAITAADGTSLQMKADMKVNVSGPVTPVFDQDGYFKDISDEDFDPVDYVMENGNKGMAFDLGAVYKLTPRISLYGSLIDMGKISFKKNLHNFEYKYAYDWTGIDISHSVDKSGDDYVDPGDLFEDELQKMEDAFKPKRSDFNEEKFSMTIPMKIYLGGTYELNKKSNIGLLERIYKSGDFTQNSLTFSGNTMVGNFLSLSASYSAIGNAYDNLGLGMAVRMGFLQFFVVGDNVLAISPARAQYANVNMGFNLLFGRK